MDKYCGEINEAQGVHSFTYKDTGARKRRAYLSLFFFLVFLARKLRENKQGSINFDFGRTQL